MRKREMCGCVRVVASVCVSFTRGLQVLLVPPRQLRFWYQSVIFIICFIQNIEILLGSGRKYLEEYFIHTACAASLVRRRHRQHSLYLLPRGHHYGGAWRYFCDRLFG